MHGGERVEAHFAIAGGARGFDDGERELFAEALAPARRRDVEALHFADVWLVERTHGDAAEGFAGCVARDEERAGGRCVFAGERREFGFEALVAEIDGE